MRIEPSIDKVALAATIHRNYGLSVTNLMFVPQGEVSFSYVVTCADGARYYLKLLDDSSLARFSRQRLDFYLPLTYTLHTTGLFPYVPYPIKTLDGRFYTMFEDFPLILANYIDGENPTQETMHTSGMWDKLAHYVALLHSSTADVAIDCPYVERFTIPFEAPLRKGLDTLNSISELDATGLDLQGIEQNCVGGWSTIEPGIEQVKRQLSHYETGY